MSNPFDRLWLEYFTRTPWFDVDMLGNLAEDFRTNVDELAAQFQLLMTACVKRSRAFFVSAQDREVVRQMFAVHKDEPFVENRDENSLTELLSKMEKFRGKRLFVLFHNNYGYLRAVLSQNEFVEGQDFIDGELFMAREQRGKLRPEYRFVRAL